ncbi:MAG: hypothetical protein ACLRYY_07735 [Anaerobutyricum soehngenii]
MLCAKLENGTAVVDFDLQNDAEHAAMQKNALRRIESKIDWNEDAASD